jgi:hypothetical protein
MQMEELKRLEQLQEIDERHALLSQVTGRLLDPSLLHSAVSKIELNETAPDDIKSQFNVARNMALYSYFCYSFAPEVQAKTFVIIEHALRLREGSGNYFGLKKLLKISVNNGWITDTGFRHLNNPGNANSYSKSLIEIISMMRNEFAHGTNILVPDCLTHLSVCADFINQLYPVSSNA